MRILVVHNRYRSATPSGEDRVVDQESAALAEAGHEVELFERLSDEIATYSLRQKALVPGRVVWSMRSARELEVVLQGYRPDVVHAHNLLPLLSPSVLLACQKHDVPSVVTFHNFRTVCAGDSLFREGAVCRACVDRHLPLPSLVHGCYRNSSVATVPRAVAVVAHRRLWGRLPSAYIFLSDAQRRELEPAGFPVGRSFVKPNLVPPAARRVTSEGLVVYLGRLTEEKGLRVLMKGWDHYLGARRVPSLKLAVAGTGPMDAEIRSWARTRPSVEVLGLIDRDACSRLVARAEALVAPSEWPEPFGLVVAEAMAAGVLPIATNHGAFKELIAHGVDGVLYPLGDFEMLGCVLLRVENDPVWTNRLGQAAYQTYLRRFEPSRNVAELEHIYRFAIGHPRRRSTAEPG